MVFMQPNVIDAIKSCVGKVVVIETAEGVTRRGKLTQIRTRVINVGVRTGEPREFVPGIRATRSRDFNFPIEFILDGDAADPIPFATCSRFDVDGVAEKIDVVAELAEIEKAEKKGAEPAKKPAPEAPAKAEPKTSAVDDAFPDPPPAEGKKGVGATPKAPKA